MKKIVSGILAVLLVFVSGRYVLLDAVKAFLQSAEETGLHSQEYNKQENQQNNEISMEENTQEFDETETYDDESSEQEVDYHNEERENQVSNEENNEVPLANQQLRGSVAYEVGSNPSAANVVSDAGIDISNIYFANGVDFTQVNFGLPGVYQLTT